MKVHDVIYHILKPIGYAHELNTILDKVTAIQDTVIELI